MRRTAIALNALERSGTFLPSPSSHQKFPREGQFAVRKVEHFHQVFDDFSREQGSGTNMTGANSRIKGQSNKSSTTSNLCALCRSRGKSLPPCKHSAIRNGDYATSHGFIGLIEDNCAYRNFAIRPLSRVETLTLPVLYNNS